MASNEMTDLVHSGRMEDDVNLVKRILDTDRKGTRSLTSEDCFTALEGAIGCHEQDISCIILDYAENVYTEETINREIEEKGMLYKAVCANNKTIAKRLIDMRNVPVDGCLLTAAVHQGHTEMVQMLLAAGCSPHSVLSGGCHFFSSPKYSELECTHAWKVLLPYWTPDDVMQSHLMTEAQENLIGGRVLLLFSFLGMDFQPYLSPSATASRCMQSALSHGDASTVQFLLDNDFDVNACIDSRPLLHHLSYLYRQNAIKTHDALLCVMCGIACPVEIDTGDLASLLQAIQSIPVEDCPLQTAFREGHADIVKVIITAGYSPKSVLGRWGSEFPWKCLCPDHEEVWNVLLPCWTADDVMQSKLLASAIEDGSGGHLLELLEELGVDFRSCISQDSDAAKNCMQTAIQCTSNGWNWRDIGAIQFLVDHEFDVNVSYDSQPFLNQCFERYRDCYPEIHNVILSALKRANPLLKDDCDRRAVDICIQNYRSSISSHVRCGCGKLLSLLIRIGFRIPVGELHSLPSVRGVLRNALIENCSPPTLLALCRQKIRTGTGTKLAETMDQLQPHEQKLKDFIQLKDIVFAEFGLDDYYY